VIFDKKQHKNIFLTFWGYLETTSSWPSINLELVGHYYRCKILLAYWFHSGFWAYDECHNIIWHECHFCWLLLCMLLFGFLLYDWMIMCEVFYLLLDYYTCIGLNVSSSIRDHAYLTCGDHDLPHPCLHHGFYLKLINIFWI
jgi:hypothetical protein